MSEAERAMSALADWCARQERCLFDARQKLASYSIEDDEKEQILNRLIAEEYLDDSRYSRFYVRDKFRFNGWGRIKIRWQLSHKKIDRNIIDDALQLIDEVEYFESLNDLLSRKIKTLAGKDYHYIKGSLLRFSQSRGFEYEIALKIIDELMIQCKRK